MSAPEEPPEERAETAAARAFARPTPHVDLDVSHIKPLRVPPRAEVLMLFEQEDLAERADSPAAGAATSEAPARSKLAAVRVGASPADDPVRFSAWIARRHRAVAPSIEPPTLALRLFSAGDADRYAREWGAHLWELVANGEHRQARRDRRGMAMRAPWLALELRVRALLRRRLRSPR